MFLLQKSDISIVICLINAIYVIHVCFHYKIYTFSTRRNFSILISILINFKINYTISEYVSKLTNLVKLFPIKYNVWRSFILSFKINVSKGFCRNSVNIFSEFLFFHSFAKISMQDWCSFSFGKNIKPPHPK